MKEIPDISVITPALNAMPFLPLCHASVMDQEGVKCEHIVVDGGSTDGTVEWLKNSKDIVWISEPDKGLYDALNKGIKIARGKLILHLNSDEQLLENSVRKVVKIFDNNPEIDMVYGSAIVIDKCGNILIFRKAYPLRIPYIFSSHLYIFTAAIFWRREWFKKAGYFDTDYKVISDTLFVIRSLEMGCRTKMIKEYISAFMLRGNNLSVSKDAERECKYLHQLAPLWMRILFLFLNIFRYIEKLVHGSYFQNIPFEYAVYTQDSLNVRKRFKAVRASRIWRI